MTSLADARFNFYASSLAHILAEDRLFVANVFKASLANGGSLIIGLTTSSKVTSLPIVGITNRSNQTELEVFEGGAYSGGAALDFYNMNRALNKVGVPFTSSFSDVTIDTPGNRIRRETLLGSTDNKVVTGEKSSAGMLLKPNTVYYLIITNDDGTQAADYDVQMVAAVGD